MFYISFGTGFRKDQGVGQWSAGSSNNQQWTQETVGGNVKYKNRATGLYLDGMGSTANGSNLCQWSGSSSTNQQWQKQ